MHRALQRRAFTRWLRPVRPAISVRAPAYTPSRDPVLLGWRKLSTESQSSSISRQFTTSLDSSARDRAHQHDDTIYALSTAAGKAGIAVIRISGPACKQIYHGLCPDKAFPRPRYAAVRTLCHPVSADYELLDSEALMLYFPSPRTVTGEDVLELHIHGGRATIKAVLSAIPQCGIVSIDKNKSSSTKARTGIIRYAEPGEFTRRAFLNDRLDLAQVEALSETLSAETEQQRRAAVRGNSGNLGRTYDGWRMQLVQARAEMEALIDFSEDQHFDESPALLAANVTAQVRQMLTSIELHEQAGQRSELLRSGIKIALLGPPNVGKSSLMNQLVGREASIVSGESGTTRDIIEANLDIRGYLCTFADTAGFRTAASSAALGPGDSKIGAIEEEGIRRARAKAQDADVIIAMASVEPRRDGISPDKRGNDGSKTYEIRFDRETLNLAAQCGQCLVVINKRDSLSLEHLGQLVLDFRQNVLSQIEGLQMAQPILISCNEAKSPSAVPADNNIKHSGNSSTIPLGDQRDPGGISAVADTLVSSFAAMTSLPQDMQDLHGVTERQRQLLAQCRGHLLDYLETVGEVPGLVADGDHGTVTGVELAPEVDITMAAEHLRYAATCLGRITGRGDAGDVEEILGVIFEKFCVGK